MKARLKSGGIERATVGGCTAATPKLVGVWRRDERERRTVSFSPQLLSMLAAHVETSPVESPMQKRYSVFTLPPTFLTITPRLTLRHPRRSTNAKMRSRDCTHAYAHTQTHTHAHRSLFPRCELPRHGITSLEDSHLPNCVPVFILLRDLFRLHDACIRILHDLSCRQMIAIVVYFDRPARRC